MRVVQDRRRRSARNGKQINLEQFYFDYRLYLDYFNLISLIVGVYRVAAGFAAVSLPSRCRLCRCRRGRRRRRRLAHAL